MCLGVSRSSVQRLHAAGVLSTRTRARVTRFDTGAPPLLSFETLGLPVVAWITGRSPAWLLRRAVRGGFRDLDRLLQMPDAESLGLASPCVSMWNRLDSYWITRNDAAVVLGWRRLGCCT